MVTKEQALTCDSFHYIGQQQCSRIIGLRGGVKERLIIVRRTGATKTWKRSPECFRVPVKYGLYESAEITEVNAADWHCASECPLDKKG